MQSVAITRNDVFGLRCRTEPHVSRQSPNRDKLSKAICDVCETVSTFSRGVKTLGRNGQDQDRFAV